MIKIFQKTIKDQKLKTLDEFKKGSWIYVEDPDEKEIKVLAKKFSLEEGLLHDALDPNEVPRMEIEDGVTYIFARAPYKGANQEVITVPILVAMGKDFVVTVSSKRLPFLEKFTTGEVDFYTTQKTKLFLQIFSEIGFTYSRFLTDINRRVRRISVRLEKIENQDIIQFVAFENNMNDFLSSLVPINSILQNLLSGKFIRLYEEDEDLAEDLFLSNGQSIEICRNNLKTIVNIRESYSAIMTHNLNRTIKLLTALTIILTSSNLIASFYGMNVALPFADAPLAFAGILGGMSIVIAVLLGIFIKQRWL